MSLCLVKEFSDTQYPFVNMLPFESDYLDPLARSLTKNSLMNTLRFIDANDYKLIEKTGHYELRFRQPYDHVHFDIIMEANAAAGKPFHVTTRFLLPDEKRKYNTEIWKLKKWFKQAITVSGVTDTVKVKIDSEARSIVLKATDVRSYFQAWHHMPDHRRKKITHHNKDA